MATDPRAIIDREPMSGFQWGIVAIMVGLNALDGFDVLSISYASPGIAKDWGIERAALGVVLSMELIGMAFGSVLLGNVADSIGRRRTILGCLVVMAGGMFAASQAHNVETLSVCRVITGLGIGGMLAAINGAVAEAANARRRSLCVMIMAAGYPIGSIIGGSISAVLLQHYSWHSVFLFGAIVTAAFIPLVLWRAPESIAFEIAKGRPGALDRVNRTLARMGHATVDALPADIERPKGAPLARLFAPDLAPLTILMTVTYFAHVLTFYYFIKWIPKLVVDMGFDPSSAAQMLVAASVGGAAGSLMIGALSGKVRVLTLTLGTMVFSTLTVIVFGQAGQADYGQLWAICCAAGFFINAGIAGLYTLVAKSFPTIVRTSATGVVVGIGRGGSALAPIVSGLLFAGGFTLPVVSLIMALGSAVAAVALFSIRKQAVD